jgi:transcriptional regulator with XRE-family HTH domain
MSQTQVAVAAGLSRAVVSTIERGLLEDTSLRLMRRVAASLGISFEIEPRWRGAELATLLDERHARLVEMVVARLTRLGWQVRAECTFSIWGERGAVDVLAWHPARRAVLCVEVKTKIADIQDLLSTMDRKRRLAPNIARAEGWSPLLVGSVLVVPSESWARHAVRRFDAVLATALPDRTSEVHAWLKMPNRDLRAIWFLFSDGRGSTKRAAGGSMRVRPRKASSADDNPRSAGSPMSPGATRLVGPKPHSHS